MPNLLLASLIPIVWFYAAPIIILSAELLSTKALAYESIVDHDRTSSHDTKSNDNVVGVAAISVLDSADSVLWPIHYHHQQQQQQEAGSGPLTSYYHEFMSGCYKQYGTKLCNRREADRLHQNLFQPVRQRNYTKVGYVRKFCPEWTYTLIRRLWDSSSRLRIPYAHEAEFMHLNHWAVSTDAVLVNDPDGDFGLTVLDRRKLMGQIQSVATEWIRSSLIPTLVSNIQIYWNGSVIAPHVDGHPSIITALIHVAQDTLEDWPIQLIGHDEQVVNITLQPGEMVLYEGHSVIHGRPYPLRGVYSAYLYVQFEPLGYVLDHSSIHGTRSDMLSQKFERALRRPLSSLDEELTGSLQSIPAYLDANSDEAAQWTQMFTFSREAGLVNKYQGNPQTAGATHAHIMADSGNLRELRRLGTRHPAMLHQQDGNGWLPMHEAVRAGHVRVVQYLLGQGANVNARTGKNGMGGSPLWWAKKSLPEDHPMIRYLQQNGGFNIEPGSN